MKCPYAFGDEPSMVEITDNTGTYYECPVCSTRNYINPPIGEVFVDESGEFHYLKEQERVAETRTLLYTMEFLIVAALTAAVYFFFIRG